MGAQTALCLQRMHFTYLSFAWSSGLYTPGYVNAFYRLYSEQRTCAHNNRRYCSVAVTSFLAVISGPFLSGACCYNKASLDCFIEGRLPLYGLAARTHTHDDCRWRQKAPRAASLNNWHSQPGSTQNCKGAITFSSLCFSFHVSLHPPMFMFFHLLSPIPLVSVCSGAAVCSIIMSPEAFLVACWRQVGGRLINVTARLSWSVCNGTNYAFLMSPRCLCAPCVRSISWWWV